MIGRGYTHDMKDKEDPDVEKRCLIPYQSSISGNHYLGNVRHVTCLLSLSTYPSHARIPAFTSGMKSSLFTLCLQPSLYYLSLQIFS